MPDTPSEQDREFARQFAEKHRDAPLGDIATRRLSENERIVVWEMELAPGQATDLHRHGRDYIVVVLEGDRVAAIPAPDSAAPLQFVDVEPGKTAFVPRGGSEWAVNVGNGPYREILIELKD